MSKKLRASQGYSREIRIVMAKLPPFELSKGKFLVGDMGAVVKTCPVTSGHIKGASSTATSARFKV